jgi:hypothetical protein
MITKETAMTKATRKSTPKSRAAFVAKLSALCAKHNVLLFGDQDGNAIAHFLDGGEDAVQLAVPRPKIGP